MALRFDFGEEARTGWSRVRRTDKENLRRFQLVRESDEQVFTREILFVDPTDWIRPLNHQFVGLTKRISHVEIFFVDPTNWIQPLANPFVGLTKKISGMRILFVDPTSWIRHPAHQLVGATSKFSRVKSSLSIQPTGFNPLPTSLSDRRRRFSRPMTLSAGSVSPEQSTSRTASDSRKAASGAALASLGLDALGLDLEERLVSSTPSSPS